MDGKLVHRGVGITILHHTAEIFTKHEKIKPRVQTPPINHCSEEEYQEVFMLRMLKRVFDPFFKKRKKSQPEALGLFDQLYI